MILVVLRDIFINIVCAVNDFGAYFRCFEFVCLIVRLLAC